LLVLTHVFNKGGLLSETNKEHHRKIALSKRNEINANLSHDKYYSTIRHFFHEWISVRNAVSVIGLYYPVKSEMNTLSLIDYLYTQGKITCLPMVISKNEPLIFKPWSSGNNLVVGHYGIPVPDNDQIVTPDLIICPLLAYDSKGMRLGYGGGFYDRTIRYLRRNKQTGYIGLAFSEQKSYHDLPSEVHDVPLDAVLTETGMNNF
jgi:5-formyltetrahydrofolate cyclo-ligase